MSLQHVLALHMGVARKTASDFWILLAGTVATIAAHMPDIYESGIGLRISQN